jgi:hypothetical protein
MYRVNIVSKIAPQMRYQLNQNRNPRPLRHFYDERDQSFPYFRMKTYAFYDKREVSNII